MTACTTRRTRALTAFVICASCANPPTDLIVTIDTDLSSVSQVRIQSIDSATRVVLRDVNMLSPPYVQSYRAARGQADTVALRITVTGTNEGVEQTLVSDVTTAFLPRQTRALPVFLSTACRGYSLQSVSNCVPSAYCCATGSTCSFGRCVDARIDPNTLPNFVHPPTRLAQDGGVRQFAECTCSGGCIPGRCASEGGFPQQLVFGKAAAADSGFLCALRNGELVCAGRNHHGQLGLRNADLAFGGTMQPVVSPTSAGRTLTSVRWRSVALGEEHACGIVEARDAQGESGNFLVCWGNPIGGQPELSLAATDVSAPEVYRSGATTVSAGVGFSCATFNTGIDCWGRNDCGQLGVSPRAGAVCGNVREALTRVVARAVPYPAGETAESMVELVSGDAFTCVRTVRGAVYCFGSNDRGQLGSVDPGNGVRLVALPASSIARALAASADRACALLEQDGASSIMCWGAGSAQPRLIDVPSANVFQLATARSGFFARSASALATWGQHNFRDLCATPSATDVPSDCTPVTQLWTGGSAVCWADVENHVRCQGTVAGIALR